MRRLLLITLAVVTAGCSVPVAVVQPIAFSHKKHTVDNDMACGDCHVHVAREAYSGRPTIEICAGCHDAPSTGSADEAKLLAFAARGEEVPWQRLYRVPTHVRYSHARHVTGGGVDCKVCHGLIGESERPPEAPAIALTMTFCLDCHFARGVSTDCILCHR